jgi:simple sugar transport system ATP-binding protein
MKKTTKSELAAMGIDLRDVEQPIGTLSGGERQCVAIARAVHFGARVLILDEPTAALGVKQSGVVLKYIAKARDRGLGVVFITHNPHHAYPVGNRFMLLRRGRSMGEFPKEEVSMDDLTSMMAGGTELEALSEELQKTLGADSEVVRDFQSELKA